eukprot:3717817-Rhodomonas_salina.1
MGQVKWEFMDNIQQKYSQGKERLAAVGQSDRVLQRKLEVPWAPAPLLRRVRVWWHCGLVLSAWECGAERGDGGVAGDLGAAACNDGCHPAPPA